MNFDEFAEKYGCEYLERYSAKGVFIDNLDLEGRIELYRLKDYRVSGASGGLIWLQRI
jgi:hypothetical protein